MDGTTVASIILNVNNLTESNLLLTSASSKRTNFTIGDTAGNTGTLSAFCGFSSDYTNAANTASLNTQGFGYTTATQNVASSSGKCRLVFGNDQDYYSAGATNLQGFYKSCDMTVQGLGIGSNFVASASPYSMSLRQVPVGGSSVTTTAVSFYIDSLNAAPTASNVAMISGSGTSTISGVPSFTTTSTFGFQFRETNIAGYFLNNAKQHASALITTSGGTSLSSALSMGKADVGSSHKYYDGSSVTYQTSSTLHNTSGTQLSTTPGVIQFNDFTITLNSASSIFDEALVVKVTPQSLYGTGTQVSGAYISPSTGTSQAVRLDTKAIAADRSASTPGTTAQHVTSGTGTLPTSGYGTAYNHTTSLLTNEELQLVNGRYETPAVGNGYKNYTTGYYFPGSPTLYDYSTITSSSTSVRYVTLKFKPISSSNYERLRLAITHSGLTVDFSQYGAANHTVQLRVTSDTGSRGYETAGWMSCTDAVSGLGVQTGSDNTYCINSSTSTAAQRDCFILAATDSNAIVYVRIGLKCNLNASITSVTCTPMTTFT
jgi:hypothetical protein